MDSDLQWRLEQADKTARFRCGGCGLQQQPDANSFVLQVEGPRDGTLHPRLWFCCHLCQHKEQLMVTVHDFRT